MSGFFHGDASEVYRLAGDLTGIGAAAVPALRGTMAEAGKGLAVEWRKNADERFSADGHARAYSSAIDSELAVDVGGVSVDVGPRVNTKQGFLGPVLEFGGEHSPAYLDGLRALDGYQQRAERMADATVGHLFT